MKTHALILVECHEGIPDFKTEGQDSVVFGDEIGRIVLTNYDFSINANLISEVAPALLLKNKEVSLTQLTAPGEIGERDVQLFSAYGYFVEIANINTNVVFQIETTGDGSKWGLATLQNTAVPNCSITTNQMTITANGVYSIWTKDPAVRAKLVWDSESGGTDATADTDLFFRRA